MDIPFSGSAEPTLGIEVELGIIDRETRELAGAASGLLDEVGEGHPGGEHPKAKHELFESTVEIITGICDTVGEARDDLTSTFETVHAAADKRGLALLGTGTHPFSHWRDQTVSPKERYATLVDSIGWPARRLAIHGVHFHVGVPTGSHAVSVLEQLRRHLPVFLALSASSPFWHGLDTGLASCRTKVFEGLPTAGLPPSLVDWDDFEAFMGALMGAQVITSVREVWWDIRPHPDFGTIELRMSDSMPSMTDVAALAALAQSLVVRAIEQIDADDRPLVPREWVHRENKWLATRHGVDTAFIVDDAGTRRDAAETIAELISDLRPVARRLGCETELTDVVRLLEVGPSYRRQRQLIREGASPAELVDALVAQLEDGLR